MRLRLNLGLVIGFGYGVAIFHYEVSVLWAALGAGAALLFIDFWKIGE